MRKNGFTIAELCVTLSIIGIISAIMAPTMTSLAPDSYRTRVLDTYNRIYEANKELLLNPDYYLEVDNEGTELITYIDDNGEEVTKSFPDGIPDCVGFACENSAAGCVSDKYACLLNKNTRDKLIGWFKNFDKFNLIYDDITPYINLIKAIKQNSWYNELTLFSTVFFEVYNYLPSDDIGLGRAFTYFENKGKRVSIKQIRDNACAFCSEKSGMAHNMFKFLGIDSEVVCGYRDSGRHAYNIVYPKHGYNMGLWLIKNSAHLKKIVTFEHRYAEQMVERHHYDMLLSDNRFGFYSRQAQSVYMTHQCRIAFPPRS